MTRRLWIALILLSSCSFAQSKRPFTFEDMMALKRVAEPVPSPDGRWIAFSAVDVSLEKNTRKPHLWIVPAGGGPAKQLTNETAGEDRPRWSPDSRQIAYISSKDGGPQIWLADFDPQAVALGEAHKVTEISTGASGEMWSPDGKWLMFTSDVYPDCPDDACNQARDEERDKSPVKARIFTHLFFRHWSAYTGDKVTHIFVVPASGGAARDLTPGGHDAPPFSLGGGDMYDFSPDSQEVAFTSNIDEVPADSTNNEIFVVPLAGGTPKKISTSLGSDSTPRYSPDGKYIAWLMQETPGYESDRFQLALFDRTSGKIISLTKAFDRWVGSFAWSNDSKTIYFSAEDKGEAPIYQVSVDGTSVTEVIRGHWDDITLAKDGTIYTTRMTVQAPNEIWAVHLNGKGGSLPTQITDLNHDVLAQVAMQPLEPFWFTSAKDKVEGFIVKPPNFAEGQKYPVKFLIHGGPEGAWGDSWSFRWNPELFAANGYVVVMINPTGSTGYGQKFTQQIQGDWGGRPFDDLMRGLDYALAHYPYLDGSRVCALGASYGGYMANWILGHTDRFKCIVSHDGMFNTESAWGSTEELWFPEWEFKGTPWEQRALYRKWSPMLSATKFKTPTLVVHGQLDYRLDVSEGLQLFTTLQRLKVPSKMLYFPDEGHWVLKPQNSRLWYKTVNDWVDTYTKSPAAHQ